MRAPSESRTALATQIAAFIILFAVIGVAQEIQSTPERSPASEKKLSDLSVALTRQAVSRSIPEIANWESRMLSYGDKYISEVGGGIGWYQGAWFYDGTKVYYQIAAYTGDNKWLAGAKNNIKTYRDNGVFKVKGRVVAFALFPHGLQIDYEKTKDAKSREAVILLAKNAPFSDQRTFDKLPKMTLNLSREVAYNINCWQVARELGEQGFGEDPFINVGLRHMKQWGDWLKSPSQRFPVELDGGKTGYQPFMMALTAEALIRYAESKFASASRREEIFRSIKDTAELTYNVAFIPASNALYYESVKKQAAPDLNLLLAPIYAWLWHRGGDKKFSDMADKLFEGGVKGASLGDGKHFTENYRWSFDYVRWRSINPEPWTGSSKSGEQAAEEALKGVVIFPNPFRPSLGIKLKFENLARNSSISIVSASGVKGIEISCGNDTTAEWDGRNEKKELVPAGVYSYTIKSKEGGEKKGKIELK